MYLSGYQMTQAINNSTTIFDHLFASLRLTNLDHAHSLLGWGKGGKVAWLYRKYWRISVGGRKDVVAVHQNAFQATLVCAPCGTFEKLGAALIKFLSHALAALVRVHAPWPR